ncbi:MAG TPA: GNAT family N-acetyltransferase [Chondromyces sp.]|nr:GNAT family N-acetyltransferase [Chondromyces sp.]
MEYSIRLFKEYEDFRKMAELERLIWGVEPIPENQTMIAHQNGGLALGAFSGEELIGFSYSFAGFKNGKAYLCSHNLGIHPDYQKQGIGNALKKAQRKEAIHLGYDLITWTYDPLESVNGYLNLTKLKGICRTYIEDCYGDMPDSFSEGMPTDRFKIEWHIKEPYLDKPNDWETEGAVQAASWVLSEKGFPILKEIHVVDYADRVLVPVPSDFQHIRRQSTDHALQWKGQYRSLFSDLFEKGFTAVRLVQSKAEPVNYYLLVKNSHLDF